VIQAETRSSRAAIRFTGSSGHKIVISQIPSEQSDSTVTVDGPSASKESAGETGEPPGVNSQHQHTEHSQKDPLHSVWLRPAEQKERADSDRKPDATAQNVKHWPPLHCPPVETTDRTFTNSRVHGWPDDRNVHSG